MGNPTKKTNDGIGNSTPEEFVAGGGGMLGGMLILCGLMPLGFAAFVLFDLAKGFFDPTHDASPIRFEGTLVAPQYALFVFMAIAFVLIAIGSGILWLSSTKFLIGNSSASAGTKATPRD